MADRQPRCHTLGSIESHQYHNSTLTLHGWCLSLENSPIQSVSLVINGNALRDVVVQLGLPSPHVPPSHDFEGADASAFRIVVPTAEDWTEETMLLLTPVLGNGRPGRTIIYQPTNPLPEPPVRLVEAIGGGWSSVSYEQLAHCIDRGRLDRTARVLDVGCGIGRLAYSMAHYLTPPGEYCGLDVNADLVNWPRQHYTKHYPHLSFSHLDVANAVYNPRGRTAASAARLPWPDRSFDLVTAFSVFTHMLHDASGRYLEEMARVCRLGGRIVTTWFILNDESLECIDEGRSSQALTAPWPPNLLVVDPDRPEGAVGYREATLRSLVERAGLQVEDTFYGSWCGRHAFVGDYQDQIILTA